MTFFTFAFVCIFGRHLRVKFMCLCTYLELIQLDIFSMLIVSSLAPHFMCSDCYKHLNPWWSGGWVYLISCPTTLIIASHTGLRSILQILPACPELWVIPYAVRSTQILSFPWQLMSHSSISSLLTPVLSGHSFSSLLFFSVWHLLRQKLLIPVFWCWKIWLEKAGVGLILFCFVFYSPRISKMLRIYINQLKI